MNIIHNFYNNICLLYILQWIWRWRPNRVHVAITANNWLDIAGNRGHGKPWWWRDSNSIRSARHIHGASVFEMFRIATTTPPFSFRHNAADKHCRSALRFACWCWCYYIHFYEYVLRPFRRCVHAIYMPHMLYNKTCSSIFIHIRSGVRHQMKDSVDGNVTPCCIICVTCII